jgi:hypothetical protein
MRILKMNSLIIILAGIQAQHQLFLNYVMDNPRYQNFVTARFWIEYTYLLRKKLLNIFLDSISTPYRNNFLDRCAQLAKKADFEVIYLFDDSYCQFTLVVL